MDTAKSANATKSYEITVWDNVNGEIARKYWKADERTKDEVVDYYATDPAIEIIIERSWENNDDET